MWEHFGRKIDGYPSIDIHVNDPAKINEVYEKVKSLPEVKGKTLKAEITNEEYESISNPLESMQKMVGGVVTAITVVSIAILALLLFLWTRGRKREMGVLLAIGKSKVGIVGQLLTENLLVAVLAFAASYFVTRLIAGLRLFHCADGGGGYRPGCGRNRRTDDRRLRPGPSGSRSVRGNRVIHHCPSQTERHLIQNELGGFCHEYDEN